MQRRIGATAFAFVLLVVGMAAAFTAVRGGDASGPAHPTIGTSADGSLQAFDLRYRDLLSTRHDLVRRLVIPYTAWDGARRTAFVVMPDWYTRRHNPRLPLVLSPHGRGVSARDNLHFWGALPAFGPFIVVSPEGQGRRLVRYSWGWHGQIDDLARLPGILHERLPWVRFDRRRVYAVGSSMGGQETLLLVARHPKMLAGAAALDSDTDMRARYAAFARLRNGDHLQALAREEIGGTPASNPRAYEMRSPVHWARAIADSGVPLHIWWSLRDRIVRDQRSESGRLFRLIRADRPVAPVTEYVGTWAHSREFHASARLPLALLQLGLIRLRGPIPQPDMLSRAEGTPKT